MNKEQIKEIAKDAIVKSVESFAKKALNKRANFQVLDLIIPRERKIRSIVGGMETSLGTTLWEPLSKALAAENGFVVHESNLQCPTNMPGVLSNLLQGILEDRNRSGDLYDAQFSHDEIRRVCQTFIKRPITQFENAPSGKGVDIWLEKDNIHYFFDTKTVQPNIAALKGCLSQVIHWYAYFYSLYPTGNAEARIVFPYNPYHDRAFWDGVVNRGKPLEPGMEGWVENEFWDFCSGCEGTYTIIKESFEELRASKTLEVFFDKMLK